MTMETGFSYRTKLYGMLLIVYGIYSIILLCESKCYVDGLV